MPSSMTRQNDAVKRRTGSRLEAALMQATMPTNLWLRMWRCVGSDMSGKHVEVKFTNTEYVRCNDP